MPRKALKITSKTKKVATKPVTPKNTTYLERLENEIESNQSKVSMILGALIILVLGILVFNYFSKSKASLGPAQQTEAEQDVAPSQLPGKYTVKDGDTLFTIAEKYYSDGYKYSEIAKANNLTDPDVITGGQVLEIPKLDVAVIQTSPEASSSDQPSPTDQPTDQKLGTGGGNTTIWGPRIEEDSYTVIEGDWLSKIAGRAYGNVESFDKIAKVNNISNPDEIEPGTVLTIPR